MNNYPFEGFKENTKILGVGPLFRSISGNRWNIYLQLSPRQAKDFLSISNAPAIARNRILKATKNEDKRGWKRRFRISNARDWDVKTIGECPVQRLEKWANPNQLCFVFTIDEDITIYLPQFELARTLFFHGGYLSRTAIESDCLKSEFAVEIDHEDNAIIRVMPSASFTVAHLNEPKCRNYLSWVLLDEDARQSYESITKYQRKDGIDYKKNRRWNFQFDPPPLTHVWLQIGGQFSKDSRSCFVHEIYEIKGIPNKSFRSIEMAHPDFERLIPSEGHAVRPAGNGPESPLNIHDDIASNANTLPIIMEADSVSIEFKTPFHVNKITSKERKQGSTLSGEEREDKQISVSTEEGVDDRGLPGADWDTLNDETDYEQFFENKFDCFRDMVKILIETYGCVPVSKAIPPLPKVGRCKKHLLSTTGESRCMAIIGLQVGEKTVHLLEVDTSDADKSLSTQVLVVKNLEAWETNVERLKRELLQSSLRWPKKLLDELCGKDHHNGVNHPQAPSGNKGVLELDSIAGWATRIYGWMLRL